MGNARVELEEGQVRVSGDGLVVDRRMRLFFRGVIGGVEQDGQWICLLRGRAGSAVVVDVARYLEGAGWSVETVGAQADLALQLEVERVRSFRRAADAAAHLLNNHVPELDESAVLAALREFGWNADRPLHDHQREGLLHALTAVNSANFSVPGAGKTATATAVASTLLAQDLIDLIVVVGPLASFRPWETEVELCVPGRLRARRVRGSSRQARSRIYADTRARDLLLLSFPTAASDRVALEALFRRLRVMLIVDEAHRVKRFRGGTWAPALVNLSRFARVKLVLSGTPMPQGPLDLWSQFTILWPGGELVGSRNTYAARTKRDFDSVSDSLQPFFIRTPKARLGLPPYTIVRHSVDLAPTQREIYELIFNRIRTGLPDAASWADKIAALRRARTIRLVQAASNPDLLNEADGFYRIPPIQTAPGTLMERLYRYRLGGELPSKFGRALELVAALRDDGEKCVVWTSFIKNIDQLAALVRDQLTVPAYTVDGRVPAADVMGEDASSAEELDDTRERRIADFLSHDGPAVLIANPAACGESISLHSACHTAIYVDRTYDCARWLQSIDRIHRLGLSADANVVIHVLEATNGGLETVDGLIESSLTRKSDQMSALLQGAELRSLGLQDEDSLAAAEGSEEDLDALLRYLLGEQ